MPRIHSGNFFAGDLPVDRGWQIDSNRSSKSYFAFRLHRSASLVGKSVNLRQAEPGSFADLLGREKRIEYLGQQVWRNTHPGVAKLYRNEVFVGVIAKNFFFYRRGAHR